MIHLSKRLTSDHIPVYREFCQDYKILILEDIQCEAGLATRSIGEINVTVALGRKIRNNWTRFGKLMETKPELSEVQKVMERASEESDTIITINRLEVYPELRGKKYLDKVLKALSNEFCIHSGSIVLFPLPLQHEKDQLNPSFKQDKQKLTGYYLSHGFKPTVCGFLIKLL